jgi:glucose-6-phosphate 1-epimerase
MSRPTDAPPYPACDSMRMNEARSAIQESYPVGEIRWQPGAAGHPMAQLIHQSGAEASVHLWGATVTSWRLGPDAQEEFWLDQKNSYDATGPIRGGNPLVFPWFGPHAVDPTQPRHGFARTTPARPIADRSTSPGIILMGGIPDESLGLSLVFDFPESPERRAMDGSILPSCTLSLDVDLLPGQLRVVMAVRNDSDRPLDAEMLLHPYFAVGSALTAQVHGLAGLQYLDKTDGGRQKSNRDARFPLVPPPDAVFETRPPGTLLLERPPLSGLNIDRLHTARTVVWNSGPRPGQGPETAPPFACVEPGLIFDSALRGLAPGAIDGVGMLLSPSGSGE